MDGLHHHLLSGAMRKAITAAFTMCAACLLPSSCDGKDEEKPSDFIRVNGTGAVQFKAEVPDESKWKYNTVFAGILPFPDVHEYGYFIYGTGAWTITPVALRLVADTTKAKGIGELWPVRKEELRRRYWIGSDGYVTAVENAANPDAFEDEYQLKLTMTFERDALDIQAGEIEVPKLTVTTFEKCRLELTYLFLPSCVPNRAGGKFHGEEMSGDFDCTTLDFDPERNQLERLTGEFYHRRPGTQCGD